MAKRKITPGKPLPKGQKSQYEAGRPGKTKAKPAPTPIPAPKKALTGQSRARISPKEAFFGALTPSLPVSQQIPLPVSPAQAFFGAVTTPLPQSMPPPVSSYGTSSAQYGQVSPTGQVEVPPLSAQPGTQPGAQPTSQAPGGGGTQGVITKPESQSRKVTITNKDGSISNYQVDPKYSYISQTGQYEFDFWTAEGQKERIMNAIDTATIRTSSTAIMGEYVPVASEATTVLIDALNVATILNAGTNIFRAIAGMNKVGSLALTANGAKELAATVPEASGTICKIVAAGKVVPNTKNAATGIKLISNLFNSKLMTRTSIGAIILGIGLTGATQVRKDVSDYIKDSGALALKLRDAGMNDMADELIASNKDLKDGLDVVLPYIPYLGKNIQENKIQDYIDKLNEMNLKYDEVVKAEKEKEIYDALLNEQQAAELKRQQDITGLEDKRAYEESQQAEQRTYNEQQKAEQRTYNEEQQLEQRTYNEQEQQRQAEAQARAEAIMTETSEGSTLNFGLLNTGGATQFVDKDKAAQVYFGKVYEELTPEQKMLLNLLKGG